MYQTEFWGPREKKGYRCLDCGRTREEAEAIDVHHLDESHINDHPDNLVGLCRRCHLEARHQREDTPDTGRDPYAPDDPRGLDATAPSTSSLSPGP